MLLHKTELARAMLAQNGSQLTQQERRVLILCDGQRSLEQVVSMLGVASLGQVQSLIQGGFLSHSAQAPSTAASGGVFGKLLGSRRTASVVAAPAVVPLPAAVVMPPAAVVASPTAASAPPVVTSTASAAVAAPSVATPAPARRRSMAACKMYMIDMLQLQRTADAASLAVSLQTARGDDELVAGFIDALVYLRGSTKPTVSDRIGERLKEIVPEEHLGAIETAWVQMTADLALDLANEAPAEAHPVRADNVVSLALLRA